MEGLVISPVLFEPRALLVSVQQSGWHDTATPGGPRGAAVAGARKDHGGRLVGRLTDDRIPGVALDLDRQGALRRQLDDLDGDAVPGLLLALGQYPLYLVGVVGHARAQQVQQRRE